MSPDTIDEQLTKHLTDVHSIEEQALTQLRRAPDIAADDALAAIYREHLTETEEQERLVRERLEARGAKPSTVKDLIARAGGVGMILFARANPDTPGKLTAHAYSYEHMELAAYDLLALVAERAGDRETVALARSIREQEAAMARRLEDNFDRSVEVSLAQIEPNDLEQQLVKYIADAHAIEGQGVELLEHGPKIVGEPGLARIFEEHLEQTRSHQARLEARLDAHGGARNLLQDALLHLGGIAVGGFFGAQPDTPAKLAGFAFAFEHIEIGAHEHLKRVAARAGDDETVRTVERIVADERAQAERIRGRFAAAVDAALAAQGVSEPPQ
jgi:ferritin-like metal-binding protein YciE